MAPKHILDYVLYLYYKQTLLKMDTSGITGGL